jgi:hypothetical protein
MYSHIRTWYDVMLYFHSDMGTWVHGSMGTRVTGTWVMWEIYPLAGTGRQTGRQVCCVAAALSAAVSRGINKFGGRRTPHE